MKQTNCPHPVPLLPQKNAGQATGEGGKNPSKFICKTILEKLTILEELLKKKDDRPLTFKEACTYLGYAPSYLYKLTYKNVIPHYKPTGKMIFFSKNEVDQWIYKSSVERRVMSDELKDEKKTEKDPNQIEMELKSEDEKRKMEDTSTSLSASSEKDSSTGSTPLTTGSPGMTKEAEVVIEFPLKSRRKK